MSQVLVAAKHGSSLVGAKDESQVVRFDGDVPSALPGLAVVQVGQACGVLLVDDTSFRLLCWKQRERGEAVVQTYVDV